MSIREIAEKIKSGWSGGLQNDRVFYTGLMLATGLLCFGLGRLSLGATGIIAPVDKPAISVQKSATPTSLGIVASSTTPPSGQAEQGEGAVSTVVSAPKTQEAAAAAALTSGAYVGPKKSDKYHLPWCSGAKRISDDNKIWFATKEDAEKAGYKPAGNCPGI